MRLTEFWENMAETFGVAYASSVAADQTLPQLNGLTINEALAGEWSTKSVWIAVCEAYGERVPSRIRR
jgi:hypothetical protein